MHWTQNVAAMLALTLVVACGEATQPGGADTGEDVAAPHSSPAPTTLSNDQYAIDTVKVVFRHFGSEQGERTLWIEDYGARVATARDYVTTMGRMQEPTRNQAYWDGERSYMVNLLNDERYDTGLRIKDMEPAAVTITSPDDLEGVGYQRLGEMTIAGKTCQHWRHPSLRYETCIWNRIELLSINGLLEDGGFSLKHEAVEVVEGEPIPEALRALGG